MYYKIQITHGQKMNKLESIFVSEMHAYFIFDCL